MGRVTKWLLLLLVGVLGVGAVSGCSRDKDSQGTAPWAREVVTGEKMWVVTKEGWTITAYDMGRDVAERDSYASDDVSDEPLVKKGDSIVFVNVVATNASDATMFVGIDVPELWANPVDSPYSGGVAKVAPATDRQMTDHDVWYHSRMPRAEEDIPFAVAPGQSFAMGFVLPLALSEEGEWVFVPSLWVHATKDSAIGENLVFEHRLYTFV